MPFEPSLLPAIAETCFFDAGQKNKWIFSIIHYIFYYSLCIQLNHNTHHFILHASVRHSFDLPTLGDFYGVDHRLIVEGQLLQHIIQKLEPLFLDDVKQVLMDPIWQFIDLLDASLLEEVQGISDEHYDTLVILIANEELEHPIGVVIVEAGRGPHFVVDLERLLDVAVELCLLEVGFRHDVLDDLVEALVDLALVLDGFV